MPILELLRSPYWYKARVRILQEANHESSAKMQLSGWRHPLILCRTTALIAMAATFVIGRSPSAQRLTVRRSFSNMSANSSCVRLAAASMRLNSTASIVFSSDSKIRNFNDESLVT